MKTRTSKDKWQFIQEETALVSKKQEESFYGPAEEIKETVGAHLIDSLFR